MLIRHLQASVVPAFGVVVSEPSSFSLDRGSARYPDQHAHTHEGRPNPDLLLTTWHTSATTLAAVLLADDANAPQIRFEVPEPTRLRREVPG